MPPATSQPAKGNPLRVLAKPFGTEQDNLWRGAKLAHRTSHTLEERPRKYLRTAELEAAVRARRDIANNIWKWIGPAAQETAFLEYRIGRGTDSGPVLLPLPKRLRGHSTIHLAWLVVKGMMGRRRKMQALRELYAILRGYECEARRQIERLESRLRRRARCRQLHEGDHAERQRAG